MNINKLYLVSIIAVFILIGCSVNEDNQTDELLKGTEWEWKYLDVPPTNVEPPTGYYDQLSEILKMFSNLSYSIGDISTTESTKTNPIQGSHITHTLKFSDSHCIYEIENYSLTMVYQLETKLQPYIFSQQTCVNPYSKDTLKVSSDGLYYHPYSERRQEVHKVYSLDNFKANKFVGTDTLSIKKEKEYNEQVTEAYSYQRTDNEVIMINENKKWIGAINKTNWTMKVAQILPEKKDLHTFILK